MKGETKLISWHEKQPILTLDCHTTSRRIATGGADNNVRIWLFHDAKKGQSTDDDHLDDDDEDEDEDEDEEDDDDDVDDEDVVDLSDSPKGKKKKTKMNKKKKGKSKKGVTASLVSAAAAAATATSSSCSFEYLSTLSRHTLAVNVVRFSPNGM